jgi:TetR/AcrR family transcriptional regulator, regulator of mycofactocin system
MSSVEPSSRQHVSSKAEIERVALGLFAAQGFEETTVDEIAASAGIGRRTFFRYFPSKNDILWGDFHGMLGELEIWLAAVEEDRSILDVIAEAAVKFNRVHSDGVAAHRERMELILHTPALRAHAALRHAEWLAVVTAYAADRLGETADDLGPQVIGHVALGAANAAYELWLRDPSAELPALIRRVFATAQSLPT